MVEIAGQVVTAVDIGLFAIFLIVLSAPFKVKLAEKNLEAFLFVMGVAAVTITTGIVGKGWRMDLIELATEEPIIKGIVPAVLIAGLIFFYGKGAFKSMMNGLVKSIPMPVLVFLIVFICGMISSVITAIVTSLFLVEIVNLMPMERMNKINLVILACFSIGLGAVLTPLGEPLSTIAIAKLQGAPYHATFWYLADQIGVLVVLGCAICAAFAAFYVGKAGKAEVKEITEEGGLREVIVRAVKVYVFVAALFLLGDGMNVIIDKYFTHVPSMVLYWVNMVSAILDNATLTAAELSPAMSQGQINAALMGLLIFGGMLIPGNIPNIISAGKLGITSSEYAKLGVPFGLVLGGFFFVLIYILNFSPRLGI
jgi:predicted cation transporter